MTTAEIIASCKELYGSLVASEKHTLETALQMGRLLLELKEMCAHGEFLPALQHIGIRQQRASDFMRIAALSADSLSQCSSLRDALAAVSPATNPWTRLAADYADVAKDAALPWHLRRNLELVEQNKLSPMALVLFWGDDRLITKFSELPVDEQTRLISTETRDQISRRLYPRSRSSEIDDVEPNRDIPSIAGQLAVASHEDACELLISLIESACPDPEKVMQSLVLRLQDRLRHPRRLQEVI